MMKEWIAEYNPKNEEETLAAMREIMQEITLSALSRTDFFKKAAFYGGTALRIFHGLDRYSEDLDFSLLETDPNFSLTPYFSAITDEFEALGIRVSIREKDKFNSVSFDAVKDDVRKFIRSDEQLTIWDASYFTDLVEKMKFE